VLIDIHGGPAGQYTPAFSPLTQYLITRLGIAVIAPNVRGSSGYGKEYIMLDDFEKREHSVYDIGALLDWIARQPDLDASRICVAGGSYGGYMALASLVHYSDRLTCGIDVVGISNFVTFLENTGKYRQDLRRTEYGDERDPDMRRYLETISPLTNAHRIEKPLLVVQGLNDPRVPVTEAEQIVKAVRKNNQDVWYLLAENEGHGFAKKSNRDFYQCVKILFLKKHLLSH
jgi:dipeptidyl aminopeptidase/acylaminoacyl peptidase